MRRINLTSARLASRKVRADPAAPKRKPWKAAILLYSTLGAVDLLQPDHLQLHARRHQRRRRPQRPVPDAQRQLAPRRPGRPRSNRPPPCGRRPPTSTSPWSPTAARPVGTNGDQQDDPRFGDIRIGAVPLALRRPRRDLPAPADQRRHRSPATSCSTPPSTGPIDTTYDLDDRRGPRVRPRPGPGRVDRLLGRHVRHLQRHQDRRWSATTSPASSRSMARRSTTSSTRGTHNSSFLTATNITSYINSNGQIALAGPGQSPCRRSRNTTCVTVPATNSGQMVVTVQSSNLSSLAPTMDIYNSSLTQVATASLPTTYGATISRRRTR